MFWDKRIQKPELNLLIVQSKIAGTVLDLATCLSREGGSNPNYTIKGSSLAKCNNGTWSSPAPTCTCIEK